MSTANMIRKVVAGITFLTVPVVVVKVETIKTVLLQQLELVGAIVLVNSVPILVVWTAKVLIVKIYVVVII